jgi:vacuolar-type H+-ATPase subunit C/Vma6
LPLPLSSRKLERAFNENLIETYIKIIKNSPKKAAKYLSLYVLRFELENIKALIKTLNAKMSPEQRLARVYISAETFPQTRLTGKVSHCGRSIWKTPFIQRQFQKQVTFTWLM